MDSPYFAGRLKTHAPEARVFKEGHTIQRRKVVADILPRPHAVKSPAQLTYDRLVYKISDQVTNNNPASVKQDSRGLPRSTGQRQGYIQPIIQEKKSKSKFVNLKPRALMAASIALLIFGGWVSFIGLKTNYQAEAQVKHLAAASSSDDDSTPSEKRPDPAAFGSFKVAPSLPKYIKITKIGVNARIFRMGVKSNNQLRAPSNIYDAGWYENSAKPGDASGAMLIDGHVHGPTMPGVFMNLNKLQAGDEITITRGDDQIFKYKVASSKVYDADNVDMDRLLVSADSSKEGLNLITCTGSIEKGTTEYSQRLAVFAVAE
jgi:LPXTG-site transpeptidase (sortase) family protein